ncbi:uncharacterized protein EMH_0088010 [Eimeria mitis]|uniref:F5/8 type C domain-containing protein n=1 Tax=Eimeria mitis TaxID=44415 RepID=U6JRU3_9EIME|nr:uncharacterized protein EMH_0088010 [Eimeria mitis]CDJ27531.1 hypothetical protein, conserved [Eimeria mitis]
MNIARGELVVVDSTGGRISTIHLTTGVLTDIKTGVTQPEGVAVSDDGNTLYVSQSGAGKVVAINLNEKTESDLVSNLSSPAGLCLSLDGATLYVAEAAANKVSSINIRAQTKTDVVGQGATADIELNNPRAVAVSLDGEIYVADGNSGNSRIIRALDDQVEVLEIHPPLLRTMKESDLDYVLGDITSMAYGKLANPTLFLADSTKHIIWKLDLQTHRLEQILGTGTKGFTGDGRIIPAPEAAIDSPTGFAVADQLGSATTTLYILDSGNKRVRKVYVSPADRGESSTEVPCPEGTFSNSEGGSTEDDCIPCPAGVFTNVALKGEVELTISGDYVGSGTPDKVTNGDTGLGTGWVSKNTSSGGHGLTIDFGDIFFINEVTVISGRTGGKNILSSFSVHYFHSASSTYVELFSVTSNKESTYSLNFGEVATRKIMLTTSDSQVYLSEIQVSGTSSPGPAAPTPCPKGWYQDLKAQTACKICPEGYFCKDSTVTPSTKCPAGYYCPKGSYNGHEYPCPLGTYNKLGGAKGASECLPCPGYYCKGGAWSPAPHPDEKNPDGISGSAGSLCPIGYYCQAGTESPEPCRE